MQGIEQTPEIRFETGDTVLRPQPVVRAKKRTRRLLMGAVIATGLVLTGCAPEVEPVDHGKLRIQVDCSASNNLYTAEAQGWFFAGGFSETSITDAESTEQDTVAQLSRGQVHIGIMPLSTVADAILNQALPLVVVGVLPGQDTQRQAYVCSPHAEAAQVSAANPLVLVTTSDVLMDDQDVMESFLASEIRYRNSYLGVNEQNLETVQSEFQTPSGEISVLPAVTLLSSLTELASTQGLPLSAERLVATDVLEQAAKMAASLEYIDPAAQ